MSWISVVGDVLVWAAAIPATLSVILHGLTPWRATAVGRNLFWYALVVAAILDLSLVRTLAGDTAWFAALRLVVFAAVPVVLIWRVALQVNIRRHDPPRDDR
jgi:hypothetical protein